MNVKLLAAALLSAMVGTVLQADVPPPAIPPQDEPPEPPVVLNDLDPVRSKEPAQVPRPLVAKEGKVQTKQKDRLKLLGGGSLSGKFLGLQNGRVRWEHDAFDAAVSVDTAAVDSIRVQRTAPPFKPADCRVSLVTGESIMGRMKSLDETGLIIETWYAGPLTIPREAIQMVEPSKASARMVYEGPEHGPDGWMTGNRNTGVALKPFNQVEAQGGGVVPAQERALEVIGLRRPAAPVPGRGGQNAALWRYSNKGFVSMTSGPILGRKDLGLPDKCALEFDFKYIGYFNLGINVFADQIKNEYSGNSYSLRLDQSNAYLYRIQNGSTSNLGNAQSQLAGKTECRIVLLIDKSAKSLALVINDRLVHKWEDGQGSFAGKGNGILFTSRNNSAMRVSRIRIREWDGVLPNGDKQAMGNGKEDYVKFNNGDGFSGRILRMDGDKLVFKTSFGEVPVPMNTVEKMSMINPVREMGDKPAAVSTNLAGGGALVLEFLGWDARAVKVRHKFMGEFSMDPAVFESLKFNLDQPRQREGVGLFDQ